jgi:hypothetical protein
LTVNDKERRDEEKSSIPSSRTWGFSSSGRAPALQAGGERFDPVNLHQFRSN